MIWRILPHLSACIASGQVMLLDLRQNRYFAVPAEYVEVVLLWLRSGEYASPPAALVAMLVSGGTIRPGDPEPSNTQAETLCMPDSMPSQPDVTAPIRMTTILSVAVAVTRTWTALRVRPLERIMNHHGRRSNTGPPLAGEALDYRAQVYDRARRLVPIPRNCLLDSLALDQWLAGGGGGRTLVLGVAAHPFAAHCWLQTGTAILNDSCDRVSRYTPILTV